MNQQVTKREQTITKDELLQHWQGHRGLTRRVIESFPEKDFFSFSIGGMRTPAELSMELLAIAGPGLKEIATGETSELREHIDHENQKALILEHWDAATGEVNKWWEQIPVERFHEEITTFGRYPGTVLSSIQYFIDNEIHHRGQMYVYLRALGVEPPAFWDR